MGHWIGLIGAKHRLRAPRMYRSSQDFDSLG
jgi:hypothetical protein